MHRTRTLLIKIVMQAVHFIIVLLGISFLTFSIMHLSPRNPAELWLVGADGSAGMVSEEAVAEQERIMGLDRPFLVQYGIWLGNAVRGDLGTSFTYRTPVTEELAKHMAPTAGMTVIVVTVTVLDPGFLIPRMVIQVCSPSIMTITPFGCRFSMNASAI